MRQDWLHGKAGFTSGKHLFLMLSSLRVGNGWQTKLLPVQGLAIFHSALK
jgi:hypothetical protein